MYATRSYSLCDNRLSVGLSGIAAIATKTYGTGSVSYTHLGMELIQWSDSSQRYLCLWDFEPNKGNG